MLKIFVYFLLLVDLCLPFYYLFYDMETQENVPWIKCYSQPRKSLENKKKQILQANMEKTLPYLQKNHIKSLSLLLLLFLCTFFCIFMADTDNNVLQWTNKNEQKKIGIQFLKIRKWLNFMIKNEFAKKFYWNFLFILFLIIKLKK